VSVEIFAARGSGRVRARIVIPPEVSIAFQVARELRFSQKFKDDGAPEGTLERPAAGHPPKKGTAVDQSEIEDELDLYLLDP
jgi:hypothetical protein